MVRRALLMTLLLAGLSTLCVAQEAASDDTPPPDYVAYDKAAEPEKMVQPKYPAAARTSGAQGTVWMKLWIGKDGKVKKAIPQKTDSEYLNQAAVDAAMQWTFSPATIRNAPVAVWVSIPFRFRLTK